MIFGPSLAGRQVAFLFYAIIAATLLAGCQMVPSTALSQARWVARHNMTSAQYQQEFDRYTADELRLTYVSGYSVAGSARYAALWEERDGPPYVARHGLTSAQYQSEFDRLKAQGYRLVHVSGFAVGGSPRFAAIWEQRPGVPYVARHDMTSAAYQSEFDRLKTQGYRLVHVSGYAAGGSARFAAIWERRSGPPYVARHGMTSAQYQSEFDSLVGQGYRLVHVSGYAPGGQVRYAAIWERRSGPGWVARHGLTSANYQSAFDNQYYSGYRLRRVSAFAVGQSARFAAIWTGGGFSRADFDTIDKAANDFMTKYDVPGMSIAFTRSGRLVFAKGYGLSDKEAGWETSPLHLFRIASVTKPITASAIMRLVEQGKLKLDQPVFGASGVLGTTYGTQPYDTNIEKITVRHLLEHVAGGWSKGSDDPMFQQPNKSQSELISWVLDNRPLDNLPGTQFAYSNFGYCLLGRIIEKVSGMPYPRFVYQELFTPAGVHRALIASDTRAGRHPEEVVYYGQGGEDPYGMKVTRMDSHGGWNASVVALMRFIVRVDRNSPSKPDVLRAATIDDMVAPSALNAHYAKGWGVNAANNWWHDGTLPGTRTFMARASNGFNWAILMNTRTKPDEMFDDLDDLGWTIINGVGAWPSYDLF